jgi:ABC-type glycerol-3-phosphate transport system substrate-binding protein
MTSKSLFQTILLVIFGGGVALAVLVFAGILPGFRSQKIGQSGRVEVWGSFSQSSSQELIETLRQEDQEKFTLNYVDQGNDLEKNMIEALASGKGPDVIIAPHELILKHQDKFVLIPFTSIPLRSYQEAFIDESALFVKNDGLLALPLAVDPLLLYYNKDLYNNAGIIKAPTNWEEFIKIQPLLTKVSETKKIEKSAFALGTFSNNNNAKDILSLFILQAGGSPVISSNDQISVTLDSNFGFTLKPAEAALSFFLQFADPVKSTYCWNRSLPEARDSFLGESLSNYFGFASEGPYLKEKNPHLNFDLSLVPQMEDKNRLTFGRLYGVAVLKTSRKLNSAWPMTFALASEKYSPLVTSTLGLAPVRRSLLIPKPDQPEQKIILDSSLISRGWFDFSPAETKAIFQTMSDNASTGRLSVAKAVELATKEILKLLGQS